MAPSVFDSAFLSGLITPHFLTCIILYLSRSARHSSLMYPSLKTPSLTTCHSLFLEFCSHSSHLTDSASTSPASCTWLSLSQHRTKSQSTCAWTWVLATWIYNCDFLSFPGESVLPEGWNCSSLSPGPAQWLSDGKCLVKVEWVGRWLGGWMGPLFKMAWPTNGVTRTQNQIIFSYFYFCITSSKPVLQPSRFPKLYLPLPATANDDNTYALRALGAWMKGSLPTAHKVLICPMGFLCPTPNVAEPDY